MPNVRMPARETRDLTVDVLLERIQSNFRLLKTDSIDEAELKQDLEDLVAGLKEIGEEMMTEYRWLKDLVEEVRSEDGKARLLSRLQSDREQCLKTTTRIKGLAGLVDGTENVVEVVYKITSARSMLGRVQNPSHQRSISQSLSKISVAQEKVFDGRNGLVELNGELDRRGLVAKLQEGDEETENAAGSKIERSTGLTREAPSSHKPVVHEAPSSHGADFQGAGSIRRSRQCCAIRATSGPKSSTCQKRTESRALFGESPKMWTRVCGSSLESISGSGRPAAIFSSTPKMGAAEASSGSSSVLRSAAPPNKATSRFSEATAVSSPLSLASAQKTTV